MLKLCSVEKYVFNYKRDLLSLFVSRKKIPSNSICFSDDTLEGEFSRDTSLKPSACVNSNLGGDFNHGNDNKDSLQEAIGLGNEHL